MNMQIILGLIFKVKSIPSPRIAQCTKYLTFLRSLALSANEVTVLAVVKTNFYVVKSANNL